MGRKRTPAQSQAAIERAEEAKRLVSEGVIAEAFKAIEKLAMDRCRKSVSPAESYNASLVLQVSEQISQQLRAYIADGAAAAAELDREQQTKREARDRDLDHANYLTAAREARSESDTFATATREGMTNA